jgi:hypothetical protein
VVYFKTTSLAGLLFGFSIFLSTVITSPVTVGQNGIVARVAGNEEPSQGLNEWYSTKETVSEPNSLTKRYALHEGDLTGGNTAELEKRVFTSPPMKRIFKVFIKGTISAVTWVIDLSLRETTFATLDWSLQSSQGLSNANMDVPWLHKVSASANQYRGTTNINLFGTYSGKSVVITFTGELFATAAETIWQSMTSPPVCTMDGVTTPIESWNFCLINGPC